MATVVQDSLSCNHFRIYKRIEFGFSLFSACFVEENII